MSLINVSELLTDPDFAQTMTLRRKLGGYGSDGRWDGDAATDSSITGAWQKVSERELVQLDMGDVTQEVRKLITTQEVKASDNGGALSDRLIWNGKRYRVLKVTDNADNGFYRAYSTFEGIE